MATVISSKFGWDYVTLVSQIKSHTSIKLSLWEYVLPHGPCHESGSILGQICSAAICQTSVQFFHYINLGYHYEVMTKCLQVNDA